MDKEEAIKIPESEMGMSGYSKFSWKLWEAGICNMQNAQRADQIMREQGYRKQEWISVDERLPTCGELVLVSSMDLIAEKHGWFYLARYTNLQNDGVRFDDKRWLAEDGGIFGRVTHWMPLPEPPKESEDARGKRI